MRETLSKGANTLTKGAAIGANTFTKGAAMGANTFTKGIDIIKKQTSREPSPESQEHLNKEKTLKNRNNTLDNPQVDLNNMGDK